MSAANPAKSLMPTEPVSGEIRGPDQPLVPSLELERLRREVKARLFGVERVPLMIDRYQILGCIGEGGMGIVYAARDERLGRTVALKLLRAELSLTHDRGGVSALAGEAVSLAKLAHPNVVAVFDVGEHDGQTFVAMEYVEGQNLRRWLETPRSLADILDVYVAAGEGLAAAHRAGLVHRDFKPDNVLVASDGRPRILDFGLARAPNRSRGAHPPSFAEDATATATSMSRYGVLVGTPAYMAPEQHLGERADARSDQFGFCVALYQAVYGALPFASEDLRALSLAIVTGKHTPPPVVPGVPDQLRRAILRGLSVEADDRYASMEPLLAELRELRAQLDRGEPQPPQPDTRYDTRAIERAFGVQGGGAPSSGRPSLNEAELSEIAEEVGLDLRELAGAHSVDTASQAFAPRPAERTQFGLSAALLVERSLPALPSGDTQRRIVRDLERNLGGTGSVEQFHAGMAWANKETEVSIDRCPGGARMILRRSFTKLARRRRYRSLTLGGVLGMMFGGIMLDVLTFLGPLEPLIVFAGAALGMLVATRIVRQAHARQMDEERALLGWVADRAESLIEAQTHALGPSGSTGRSW